MKKTIILALTISTLAIGITANKVWRVPSGKAYPSWGPVNLADDTNGVTGQLPSKTHLPSIGQQVSSSSGLFNSSSASFVSVTNLSVTLTTTGRPVIIFTEPDSSANPGQFAIGAQGSSSVGLSGSLRITRDGTEIGRVLLEDDNSSYSNLTLNKFFPPSFTVVDVPSAASHTYLLQAQDNSSGNVSHSIAVNYVKLVAFEM